MLYWLIILLMLLLNRLNKYTIDFGISKKRKSSGKKIYIIIIGIIFVLMASLRSTEVGIDTNMYHTLFLYAKSMNSLSTAFSSWQLGSVEPGFIILLYYSSHYLNWQIMLTILAIISIVPVLYVIYKYSSDYWMSLFLYIAFGYFSFSMNGIRQAVAIGICMIAYCFSRKKKLFPFLICIAIAMTFHRSAILFLPVYWLGKLRIERKIYQILYFVVLAFMFVLRTPIYNFINQFSRQSFSVNDNAGGVRMFLFMVASIIAMYIFGNNFIQKNKKNENLVIENRAIYCMYTLASLMWPVASLNGELFRSYYYFHIFIILCFPNFLQTLNKKNRFFFGLIFILIGCYNLQFYIINGNLKYSPYYFFWQNY